jgi:hypothetical protein
MLLDAASMNQSFLMSLTVPEQTDHPTIPRHCELIF